MATLLTATAGTFVANTRAKASEVNAKFNVLWGCLRDALYIPLTPGVYNDREGSSITIATSSCYMAGFYTVNGTFSLDTSTARAVIFDTLAISSGSTMHIATNAICSVI